MPNACRKLRCLLVLSLLALCANLLFAQGEPRARDLGIPFDGTPGAMNAITDVAGVEVGFTTLNSGSGKLVVGQGPCFSRLCSQWRSRWSTP
jgi:D-aminopeptidase